jgi:hypothetical protein
MKRIRMQSLIACPGEMMGTKIMFLTLLSVTICFAQTDTLSLSFYPLHTGGYWEYKNVVTTWDLEYPAVMEASYYSKEVLGDTLMPNLKRYKILTEKLLGENS